MYADTVLWVSRGTTSMYTCFCRHMVQYNNSLLTRDVYKGETTCSTAPVGLQRVHLTYTGKRVLQLAEDSTADSRPCFAHL